MEARRVFIVGDSLFPETLARTLGVANTDVEVAGMAPTLEAALPLLNTQCLDAVIVASVGVADSFPATCSQLLAAYPDLPIIYADLSANAVQVITSQRVGTRSSDLLAAITALPKRS